MSILQLTQIAARAWGISPANTGGATGKAPACRVQFVDTTPGSVTVTVFSTNVDGVVASGSMTNQASSTQTYTPTTPGGVPCDGPAAAARNVAVTRALDILSDQLIATIVAAGGTYP